MAGITGGVQSDAAGGRKVVVQFSEVGLGFGYGELCKCGGKLCRSQGRFWRAGVM